MENSRLEDCWGFFWLNFGEVLELVQVSVTVIIDYYLLFIVILIHLDYLLHRIYVCMQLHQHHHYHVPLHHHLHRLHHHHYHLHHHPLHHLYYRHHHLYHILFIFIIMFIFIFIFIIVMIIT